MLFEATHVPGEASDWYCDGSTRLARPLGPAVDLGADVVVVVSCSSLARTRARPDAAIDPEPDLGDVFVNVLDALMADVFLDDLERCQAEGLDCAVVAPDTAEVIGTIARRVMADRYGGPTGLLRSDCQLVDWALGGGSPRQAELLSDLLFDDRFVTEAMAVGAADSRRVIES